MTSPQSRPRTAPRPSARHAAPKDPSRSRAALLPGTLLAAAGIAFGGLAAFPAAADEVVPRVTAASALQPVALAPVEIPALELDVNAALGTALEQGLAVANQPPPRASRDERDGEADAEASESGWYRPGTGRLTSSYGRRWGRLHAGIDLAAGVGAPIRAAGSGTVLSAGWEGGYGRAVRIVHSDGTVTLYGHLSSIGVSKGERVRGGEQIGREGNTGQSTGPHLHFEVRVNGTPVNPVAWLRNRGVRI